MEIAFIVEKLNYQLEWLTYSNLDSWLPTTYQYIEDHFKSHSTRALNFQKLIQEHETVKKNTQGSILSKYAIDSLKGRIRVFVKDIIDVLEHEKQQLEKEKQIEEENAKRHIEHLTNIAAMPKPIAKKEIVAIPEPKLIYKTRLPFGLAPELFWGILVVILGFTYFFGKNFETYQIHEENKELKEQVKHLTKDTTAMGEKTRINDTQIINLQDSLAKLDSTAKKVLTDNSKILPKTTTKKKSIAPQDPWTKSKN